jgi:hypothetical protein
MNKIIDNGNFTPPSSPELAWAEAEKHIMQKLCEITGASLEVNAFAGVNPNIIDAWFFEWDDTRLGDAMLASCNKSIHLPAYVEAIFEDRARLQVFLMRVLLGLPQRNFGNVELVRVSTGGFSGIEFNDIELAGFTARINLDIIFDSGG